MGGAAAAENGEKDYRRESVTDVVRARSGWLAVFFVGLMFAAVVVETFEALLKENVQVSYFVPLLIGHGGNTGSQSVATVIRALALGQVGPGDVMLVVRKECAAGVIMGGLLGLLIFGLTLMWPSMSPTVGLTVAVALPVVSLWSNLLGGVFPLLATRLGANPAVTSAPLMTTVVDASGLVIYFLIARIMTDL